MRSILNINDHPALIKKVLSIDNVYTELAYDGSPDLNHFVPDGMWFLLLDGSDIAGFINLKPLNNITWMPHIFIFKLYRGNGSEEWGKQVADEMTNKYGAKKFLAFTPYRTARKYAENVGFKYVATLFKSIKKKGRMLDQYMLELGE